MNEYFPTTPDTLTVEWLTEKLCGSMEDENKSIVSFTAEPLGGGYVGQMARLHFTYATPSDSTIGSAIAKFSPADPDARTLLHSLGFFTSEVNFYQHFATQVDMRTPRCYYSALDDNTGHHILLLEDLTGTNVYERLSGLTYAQALLAAKVIAHLHTKWWGVAEDTPVAISTSQTEYVRDMFDQMWTGFRPQIENSLPPEIVRIGSEFRETLARLVHDFEAPLTIIHGDFRSENLLFFGHDTAPAIIDWQTLARGPGAYDIATFFGGSLQRQTRHAGETNLLQAYYQILQTGGVTNYTFEACRRDYRRALLFELNRHILITGWDGWNNQPDGFQEHLQIVHRYYQAVDDTSAIEFLSRG